MANDHPRRVFTVAEAADALGLHPDTVYSKVAAGDWPHTRLTRKISFTQEQLDEIVRSGARAVQSDRRTRRRRRGRGPSS